MRKKEKRGFSVGSVFMLMLTAVVLLSFILLFLRFSA